MTSAPWPLGSLETRVEIPPQTFNTDSIFGGGWCSAKLDKFVLHYVIHCDPRQSVTTYI